MAAKRQFANTFTGYALGASRRTSSPPTKRLSRFFWRQRRFALHVWRLVYRWTLLVCGACILGPAQAYAYNNLTFPRYLVATFAAAMLLEAILGARRMLLLFALTELAFTAFVARTSDYSEPIWRHIMSLNWLTSGSWSVPPHYGAHINFALVTFVALISAAPLYQRRN